MNLLNLANVPRAAALVTCIASTGSIYAQYDLLPADDLALTFSRAGVEQSLWRAGGLNNPQFYSVDVDGDGLLDYYAFDRAGDVHMAFGAASAASPEVIVDKTAAVRDWPRADNFVVPEDFDGDGVVDLFTSAAETGPQGIFVFKGRRLPSGLLAFEQLAFEGRFGLLLPYITSANRDQIVYVARTDVPAIRDVDGDGDVDILSFESNGSYVYLYRNGASPNATDPARSFDFRLESRCYGGVYEDNLTSALVLATGPGVCAGVDGLLGGGNRDKRAAHAVHPGSTLSPHDLDNDGDLDLLVGDIGSGAVTALYNSPSGTTAYFDREDARWPAADGGQAVDLPFFPMVYPVAALDCSGDCPATDFLVTPTAEGSGEDYANVLRYETAGPGGAPRLVSRTYLTDLSLDHGTGAHPTSGQLDGRGAHDLIVGNEREFIGGTGINVRATLSYYECPTDTDCREASPAWLVSLNDALRGNPSDPTTSFDPCLADLDGDGDLDLLIGYGEGGLAYARNVSSQGGSVAFELVSLLYAGIDVGKQSSPAVADVNGDGLPDLLIGERNGNLNLFLNRGSRTAPNFASTPDQEIYGEIDPRIPGFPTAVSRPAFAEVDGRRVLYVGTAQGRMLVYGNLPEGTTGVATLLDSTETQAGDDLDPYVGVDLASAKPIVWVGNKRGGLMPMRIEQTVGVRDRQLGAWEGLTLHPNPSRGSFRVSGATPDATYEIRDLNGRLVGASPVGAASYGEVLPQGVYVVTVRDPVGGRVAQLKLVVQ